VSFATNQEPFWREFSLKFTNTQILVKNKEQISSVLTKQFWMWYFSLYNQTSLYGDLITVSLTLCSLCTCAVFFC